MTRDEFESVNLIVDKLSVSALGVPVTAGAARWIIEPSASSSRVLAISRRNLLYLQLLLESLGLMRVDTAHIVIGRSQKFLTDSLARLGCFPNLARTGGVHLMGSSLCNRSVIVINLTGYFFLRKVGDKLTTAMETLPEPGLWTVDYRIADRNLSGLAHEWAHIARASATGGFVPRDEPAWVREGFAEVMAGIAQSLSYPRRYSYVDFHVIRLRKFSNWGRYCRQPLREYRANSAQLAGCEYYVGALAVEYLIARMGGLERLIALFRNASESMNFRTAFRTTYGVSLGAFEKSIDGYLRAIARVSKFG